MFGALCYLRLTSLRNGIVASGARLRQPKYLLSAVVAAAYFYFFFFRRMRVLIGVSRAGAPVGASLPPSAVLVLAAAGLFLVILGLYAFAWISPSRQPRLKFTEAQVAFLFPAPISRRGLIHFHLLSAQITILISSVLLSVVLNRWSFLGGHALARAVGWWLILSTIDLLKSYSDLTVAHRIERSGPAVRRRVLAGILVLLGGLIYSAWQRAQPPTAADFTGPAAMASLVTRWIDAGPAHTLLIPFEWIAGPFAASDLRTFLLALGPAALVPALLYFAIIRLEISFEEGSIAQAEHRTQVRTAVQTGTYRGARVTLKPIRSPFPLRDQGRPELAFFWKNLIAIQAWFNLRAFIIVLCSFASCIVAANFRGMPPRAASIAPLVLAGTAMVTFYTLLAGPQLFRQDLRSDLINADLLKTYPLAGWQIVLGQILTPTLILSGILWLTLLAAAWAYGGLATRGGRLPPAAEATLLLAIAIVIPLIVLLQLLIPNGAALLFPAWHQVSRSRAAGPEAIGQRLIFVFGQLLAVVAALVPAGLLGAVLYVATFWCFGVPTAIAFATGGVVAVIAGELCVGVWWLGTRFEKLDIAGELQP